MANVNAPFGLRPSRSLGRANHQLNEYCHTTEATAIFIGDPVLTTATSTTGIAGVPDGTPYVTVTGSLTTTATFRGAVQGVRPTFTNLNLQYGPASTAIPVLVHDDPFQLFEIQSDGTGVVGDVSANAGITAGTGSTYTGLSAYVMPEAGIVTSIMPLRIIRVLPRVGNVVGAYNIYEVKINNHSLTDTVGT